jgi:catechol 2,3-dioxygenase-like lactoylglutathione lyase family enzyme
VVDGLVASDEVIRSARMETQQLNRGRLIDHIQLVVRDLPASQRFYAAVFESLGVPMGGTSDGFFWADELFVSNQQSQAAQGQLTGRNHIAFQAQSRAMVDAFHKAALANG